MNLDLRIWLSVILITLGYIVGVLHDIKKRVGGD